MNLLVVATFCLFGTTFAVYYPRVYKPVWTRGVAVSRRDAGIGAGDVYQLVRDILDKALEGITAEELGQAASNLQLAADAYLNANGGEVRAQDIQDVIDAVAQTFSGEVTVSALFDEPLTYGANVLDAAFWLLKGLVEKAEALEAAGQVPLAPVAAISMTAKSIQGIVLETVDIVIYMAQHENQEVPEEQSTPEKRWEVEGKVEHNSESGTSVGVGVKHSWKGRGLSRRSVQKRGKWSVGVTGGYSTSGGASIGGSIGYSWRR